MSKPDDRDRSPKPPIEFVPKKGSTAHGSKEPIANALAKRASDENPTAVGGRMETTNADVTRTSEPSKDGPAGSPIELEADRIEHGRTVASQSSEPRDARDGDGGKPRRT